MGTDKVIERLQARVGTTINAKYKLEALLGLGGMAAVYSATHRNGDRVALKILHPELSRMESIRERFLREGYVANKIGHAGVVRVIDDDSAADGSVYLVMELLEGETLEQKRLRAGGKLPIAESLALVDDILDVLGAAHGQQIIHRDIKPDNVFLTTGGATKLMDLGIARVLDAARATATGALMGTPAFMSPEQASGRNKETDARSDVWSTGALLFVLLTGEEVHPARSTSEQMIYAAARPARSITTLMPGLEADIAHVIDIALAFEMNERWQTATAMRNALRQAARRDEPPSSWPIPLVPAIAVTHPAPISASTTTLIHGSGDATDLGLALPPVDGDPSTKRR